MENRLQINPHPIDYALDFTLYIYTADEPLAGVINS
jgi:hypothetical protein